MSSFPTGEDGRGSCFFLYATIAVWEKVMFRRKQRKIQPHFSSKEKSEHKKSNKLVSNKLVTNKVITNKVVTNKLILYLCSQKQVRAEQQLSLFRPKYFNQVYSFRLINHHSL